MADAIILGLYLSNHVSYLHSWVLTEARQVKRHTPGERGGWGGTMEAQLELGQDSPQHHPITNSTLGLSSI